MPGQKVIGLRAALKDALRTKSGIVGFGMIIFLFSLVAAVPFIAPFDVVSTWGSPTAWLDNPRNAAPEWIDLFTEERLARTFINEEEDFSKAESDTGAAFKVLITRTRFKFEFDQFPQDLSIELLSNWTDKKPILSVLWRRPDGESVAIYGGAPTRLDPVVQVLNFASSADVQSRTREWALGLGADDVEFVRPHVALFAVIGPGMMDPNRAQVLQGQYTLQIEGILFDAADGINARMVSFGTIFGLAGTDHLRRDLMIGLIWGAPVALSFGIVAAVVTVFSQVILGALGAYYGGRVDEIIQRATDFFLILPVLPFLILIGALYTPSLLVILTVVVAFSIVGGTTKVVRSIALQVKEEPYVETAISYGASRGRILFRYILPRTLPYSFALLALAVPGFIFLEAALSFLGLGDPILPTWGAIMGQAYRNGAMYNGLWWWIAFPAFGILFTTVAFAFLGYAFDKVLNPRLREE